MGPNLDLISNNFKEHISLIERISEIYPKNIEQISTIIINAYKRKNKLLIAGNGGSAADAQHIAAELVNKFYHDRKPLNALSLSTDTSILTSWANDKNYESVLERQVEAYGNPLDVFMAISTSGNSKNLVNAIRKAEERELITIGLLGKDGGKLANMCDYKIIIPSYNVPRIQEAHEIIYHTICQLVEKELLNFEYNKT